MSGPSAKPFGSNDNSAYDSQWDERSNADRQRSEGDSARSPYAPKRDAPKRVRGGFIAEPPQREPARTDDDDAPPPRFLLGSRNAGREERGLTDFSESSLNYGEEPAKAGRSPEDDTWQATPRHAGAGSGYFAETYGRDFARNDELPEEDELRRLEESVNQLQQELASSRARDADPREGTGRRRRSEETYIEGFRVPPSLQPELMAQPAELRSGRGRMQTLLGALTASIVAAPIAYYVATSGSDSKHEPASDVRLAASESSQPRSPAPVPTRPQAPPAPVAQSAEPTPPVAVASRGAATSPAQAAERSPPSPPPERSASSTTVERSPPPRTAERSPPPRVAERSPPNVLPERSPPSAPPPSISAPERPQPSAAPERPAPSVSREQPRPSRTLDPGEVDLLVKQGQQFVAAGDLVTARMVFQRAAEAGNAVAALALGASYDPTVLSSLGVRGVDADVAKARAWYQKAKEFGSAEAARRLDVLANR